MAMKETILGANERLVEFVTDALGWHNVTNGGRFNNVLKGVLDVSEVSISVTLAFTTVGTITLLLGGKNTWLEEDDINSRFRVVKGFLLGIVELELVVLGLVELERGGWFITVAFP